MGFVVRWIYWHNELHSPIVTKFSLRDNKNFTSKSTSVCIFRLYIVSLRCHWKCITCNAQSQIKFGGAEQHFHIRSEGVIYTGDTFWNGCSCPHHFLKACCVKHVVKKKLAQRHKSIFPCATVQHFFPQYKYLLSPYGLLITLPEVAHVKQSFYELLCPHNFSTQNDALGFNDLNLWISPSTIHDIKSFIESRKKKSLHVKGEAEPLWPSILQVALR